MSQSWSFGDGIHGGLTVYHLWEGPAQACLGLPKWSFSLGDVKQASGRSNSAHRSMLASNTHRHTCMHTLHCNTIDYIALHYALHYTLYIIHYTLCIPLHCITLHYIALHCITLHYIALHCITLHYIALHALHTLHTLHILRALHTLHAYIHTYIHTHIHTYIHPYIHTSIHPYIHTSIHPYIHTTIHYNTIHYITLHT